MQRMVFAALSGGVFGLGLWMSGMTDTRKVQGWLDFFGDWDPTLAFVMGGAILPMMVAWRIAARRRVAVLGGALPAAPRTQLDRGLILGSVMFGAGWGLVGLCPGPAMAALSWGGWNGLVFMAAMVAGMLAAPPLKRRIAQPAAA